MPLVAYTDQQRSEAKAVMLCTPSQEAARDLLKQIWPEVKAPSQSTLSMWSRDPDITADPELMVAIDTERKSTVRSRIHSLHQKVGLRFERDIDIMNWTDIQKGMIAMGIATDKLLGVGKGGDLNLTLNDNRGQDRRRIDFTFGPKEETLELPEGGSET